MDRRLMAGALAAVSLSAVLTWVHTPAFAETSWQPQTVTVCQAEEGSFTGNVREARKGSVSGFQQEGDSCTVTVSIREAGFYDLEFLIKSQGGYKENYVLVDGARLGTICADGTKFTRDTIRRVYLEAGEHTVTVLKYWGYIDWDKVNVLTSRPFDESVFQVSAKLSNENASDNAKRLFSYLCDQYGQKIISGQYCDTGMNGWENLQISQNNGGKFPAILGLDMGYYSQTGKDHNIAIQTTQQAIRCWEKGGIVTLCWHWLAPEKYITGTWYSAFRPEETKKMNLTAIMNGEDAEGLGLLRKDIDNIAQELLKMQEAGVPILWRPLHEASGGWFWWGAEGSEPYCKLYRYLYHTLTEEYGLNNLIWVWNGQAADWYPGDEYVDIIGVDIYAGEHEYSSQADAFLEALSYSRENKMVVLSENGTMIDPELSQRDRAMFGFFCTWSGEFVMQDGLRKKYSQQYTDLDMLQKVYGSPLIVTRDQLPELTAYPIREDAL